MFGQIRVCGQICWSKSTENACSIAHTVQFKLEESILGAIQEKIQKEGKALSSDRLFSFLPPARPLHHSSKPIRTTDTDLPCCDCLAARRCFTVVVMMLRILLALLFLIAAAEAFAPLLLQPQQHSSRPTTVSAGGRARQQPLSAKFDGEKWVAESDEETAAAGYGVFRTFIRHGPRPALQRIFQPDDYEQAVLKFMSLEKADRLNAQGNMDAFLRNEQDWAFNRMEEQKRGFKIDYYTINPKDISTWWLFWDFCRLLSSLWKNCFGSPLSAA